MRAGLAKLDAEPRPGQRVRSTDGAEFIIIALGAAYPAEEFEGQIHRARAMEVAEPGSAATIAFFAGELAASL